MMFLRDVRFVNLLPLQSLIVMLLQAEPTFIQVFERKQLLAQDERILNQKRVKFARHSKNNSLKKTRYKATYGAHLSMRDKRVTSQRRRKRSWPIQVTHVK